jgi:hypothetical protein
MMQRNALALAVFLLLALPPTQKLLNIGKKSG